MNQRLIDLSNRLLEIPKEIESAETTLLEEMARSAKLYNTISNVEAKIKGDINALTDANGKKIYSNAEARDAEFVERIALDDDVNEMYEERDFVANSIQQSKVKIELLNNEQKNIRVILNFFASSSDSVNLF